MSTMYQEYINAYKQHSLVYGSDTAIFYQVGKFYEFYDLIDSTSGEMHTSMKRFIDILGVRIIVRKGDGPGKEDAFFAGVPEQSLHKYAALLTRLGWVVVIYEQVKDGKGAVKSRQVSRILTPGTHVEAAIDTATYVAGVWLQMPVWGSSQALTFSAMALDLTTGKSFTYEGRASGKRNSWTADDIFHFFQVYLPKECIIWWRGDELDIPTTEFLQRQFGIPGIRIQIISANSDSQGGFENSTIREEFLQRTLSVRSLFPVRQALSIENTPATERLLCSLLQRIREQYPSGFKYLPKPVQWIPKNNLFLGNQALFQLNMVSPQMEGSVLGFFQKTYTVFGRRAMRDRILYPKALPSELQKRYNEIQTILDMDRPTLSSVAGHLRHIEDLPRLHRRLSEGDITASEILLLDKSYISSERLAEILSKGKLAKGSNWSIKTIQTAMASVFSIELAAKASEDAFCFQPGCAPEVECIENEIATAAAALKTCVKKLQVWAGLPVDSLRLEFREVNDPTITGTKATMQLLQVALKGKEGIPYSGIQIHQKKSAASQIEIPFLGLTFQKILQKRLELQRTIRKVLPDLCSKIAEASLQTWDSLEEWVASVDVTVTIANVSQERGFVRPELKESATSHLTIQGLRHPLIEATKTRVEYVKHDVSLTNGWLVYGMNASGKSSLMKAVGIALILAQAGCYVPATAFSFKPFQSLFTRILNTDNLWAGLSSFAVEMTELREILERASNESLVLGDEVCSGTESVSATAIVAATLTHLHNKGAKFIFATHLHSLLDIQSLKSLPHLSVWHLKVRYDPVADRLIYERTLTPGAGSSLYGLEVARAMCIPEEVLTLAHKLRRELLGTKTEMEAPGSVWSTDIQRRECEMCAQAIVKDLEVHHIRPQRDANEYGIFSDGTQKNHMRNLIIVCSKCHDKFHNGTISVPTPVNQTSDGPIRAASVENTIVSSSESRRQSRWTDDESRIIREYLQAHPSVPPKRVVFDLGEQGIKISVVSLRTFRTGTGTGTLA